MKKFKYCISLLLILTLFAAVPLSARAAEIGRPFNDVTQNAWYYNDIYNAYANELFYGTAENCFSPNTPMNRAMLVTVLHRMAGSPVTDVPADYNDVQDGSYYEAAVNWATFHGIIEGFPNHRFGPEEPVTREQMVKIIYGYYTEIMEATPANSVNYDDFNDGAAVSEWASTAMAWAVGNDIIRGRADRAAVYLCPASSSTRAEVAAVLMRFIVTFQNFTATDYKATTVSDNEILNQSNQSKEYWFGGNYDNLNRPAEPARIQNLYGKTYNVLSIGPASPKTVYLTFDEGYENGYTPKILNTLMAKNVKAVFFVTLDFVESNPDLVRRMIDEGHVIGNHTCAHPSKGMPSLSLDAQRNDILRLQNVLRNQFNYEMTLFRFPAGIYSERSLALVDSLNMKSVFWSFAYGDYNANAQPGQASSLNKLNNQLHPGAVYLLHAISSTNAAILGSYIDNARSRGYTFELIVNN